MEAPLAADPFTIPALIIVAVEIETVAMQTQGGALGIVAALQAGEGVFVLSVATRNDDPERFQVIVDKAQDLVEALASITDELADSKVGESKLYVLETGDGLEMVVVVGGDERAGYGPVGEETVIHEVKAFRLVAKVVFAAAAVGRAGFFRTCRSSGVGRRLIRAGVEDVSTQIWPKLVAQCS